MIHVGLDTVGMNGDGFECHVKVGDKVKAGDKLITFDPEKIKAAGHPAITMMVITDPGDQTASFLYDIDVEAGKDSIATL